MAARFCLVAFLFLLPSCSRLKPEQKEIPGGTYFSVIDFAADQWETYKGQPYGMKKTVYFNGTVDSVLTNAMEVDWASVLKVFFETDISKPKFVGEYNFAALRDTSLSINTFYYEADKPKLYTRKLQITTDDEANKIESIYIEAEKNDRMGTKSVKLFYAPLQSISIQELETGKTGERKEMRVVYEFL